MSRATPRETFWSTISYAWQLIGDRGARRALLGATTTSELHAAAAVLNTRLPLMLATLEHVLDTYTSPQLLAWSRECKAAVAELDSPSLEPVLGTHDGLQALFNAAWFVAAGERVRSAFVNHPDGWLPLRGHIWCEGLLLIAWGMHREKFGAVPVCLAQQLRRAEILAAGARETIDQDDFDSDSS